MQKKSSKKSYNSDYLSKKAQLSVFIIIAVVLFSTIGLFFLLKERVGEKVPKDFEGVYSYYLSCLENEVKNGAKILGERGGRIREIEFSSGSVFMPFSNHLGFMDIGIPYWYYVSGNGVSKEQVPSKEKMQNDLNDFVKEGMGECDFSQFEQMGFNVSLSGVREVKSEIKDNLIKVSLKQQVQISSGDRKWIGNDHKVEVVSNLGGFYSLAVDIYKMEKEEMFLEKYGIDILRLYAPVDGSELSCSPKLWSVGEIRANLSNALESNVAAIKINGNYYRLKNKENRYFVKDVGKKNDFNVNFMYSRYWPTKVEIWPSEGDILRADPIGLEEGFGMINFCYVPYHFVYDLYYPVLVQIYSGDELFQFPVVVSIDKTQPRKALEGGGLPDVVPELCKKRFTKMSIYTYNVNLQPVEADIKFKCFDTTCYIGRTKFNGDEAVLTDDFPQCVNGFVIADARGYEIKKEVVSTVTDGSLNLVLARKYKLELAVYEGGDEIKGNAIIVMTKDNRTKTFSYPQTKEIELTEGEYDVKVYVYSNASVYLSGNSFVKCVDVPKEDLFGVFGAKEQRCFNLNVPQQEVGFAVSGGGRARYYFPESKLEESKKLVIDAENFGEVDSVEKLQKNYNNVELYGLNIDLE